MTEIIGRTISVPHPPVNLEKHQWNRARLAQLEDGATVHAHLHPGMRPLSELDDRALDALRRSHVREYGQACVDEQERRHLTAVVALETAALAAFEAEEEARAASIRRLQAEELKLRQEVEQAGIPTRRDLWSWTGKQVEESSGEVSKDSRRTVADRQRHLNALQAELSTRAGEGVPMDTTPRRFFNRNEP